MKQNTLQFEYNLTFCFRNSSAFSFLLQASSRAKPLRDGFMHFGHHVILWTL